MNTENRSISGVALAEAKVIKIPCCTIMLMQTVSSSQCISTVIMAYLYAGSLGIHKEDQSQQYMKGSSCILIL